MDNTARNIAYIAIILCIITLITAFALLVKKQPTQAKHECDNYFLDTSANRKCRSLRSKGVSMDTILVMFREDAE